MHSRRLGIEMKQKLVLETIIIVLSVWYFFSTSRYCKVHYEIIYGKYLHAKLFQTSKMQTMESTVQIVACL